MARIPRLAVAVFAGVVLFLAGAWSGMVVGFADDEGEDEPELAEYRADEFSFSYPAEWDQLDVPFPIAEAAGAEHVGEHTLGTGPDSWVSVYAFPMPGDSGGKITTENVELLAPALGRVYDRVADVTADGKVLERPHPVSPVAGLPALRVLTTYRGRTEQMVTYEVTQLYGQERSYVIGCHAAPGDEPEIAAACDRLMETFRPAE